MRFLLDTCTALWLFEGSKKIGSLLQDKLTDIRNELYLSDVSVLEIVIKYQLRKLSLRVPPAKAIPMLVRKHVVEILPLTTEAILGLERLPPLHRDPFDRLLVAQALTHHLTLITPDPWIHQYEAKVHWEQ